MKRTNVTDFPQRAHQRRTVLKVSLSRCVMDTTETSKRLNLHHLALHIVNAEGN